MFENFMTKHLSEQGVPLKNDTGKHMEVTEEIPMDTETEIIAIRKRAHEETSSSEDSGTIYLQEDSESLANTDMIKKKQLIKNITKKKKNQIQIQKSVPKNDKVEVSSLPSNMTSSSQIKVNAENKEHSLFSTKDHGPFCIFLKQSKIDVATKPKSALDIARALYVIGIKFQEILPISRFCWKIIFLSSIEANKAINNSMFKDRHFEAFIPGFLTRRKGVIQGVPLDLSMKELQNCIEKENGIDTINAFRLKRRNKQTRTWENSSTVCVEFKGYTIPENIKIWRVIVTVHPFIPTVRIYFKCGRIGHIARTCDSEARCLTCSENHTLSKEERCTNNNKCINCGGNHTILNKSCPKLKRHNAIIRIMALDNISFSEARRIVDNSTWEGQENINLQNPGYLIKNPTQYPPLPITGNIHGFNKKRMDTYSSKVIASVQKPQPRMDKSIKNYR